MRFPDWKVFIRLKESTNSALSNEATRLKLKRHITANATGKSSAAHCIYLGHGICKEWIMVSSKSRNMK